MVKRGKRGLPPTIPKPDPWPADPPDYVRPEPPAKDVPFICARGTKLRVKLGPTKRK